MFAWSGGGFDRQDNQGRKKQAEVLASMDGMVGNYEIWPGAAGEAPAEKGPAGVAAQVGWPWEQRTPACRQLDGRVGASLLHKSMPELQARRGLSMAAAAWHHCQWLQGCSAGMFVVSQHIICVTTSHVHSMAAA
jgi:hypothetical protein